MSSETRAKHNKYAREWHHRNKEKRNAYMREYRRNVRKRVLQLLGGKCTYCGCDTFEALEINHKNGGGTEESNKRKSGRSSTSLVMEIHMGRRGTDDLEIACIVCNAWHKAVKLNGLSDGWNITWSPQPLS